MCGMCARMVVAPRPRVSVPVQPNRPPVPVPVARPAPVRAQAVPVPAPGVPAMPTPATVAATSPWVRQRAGGDMQQANEGLTVELGSSHDGGLLERGIRTEPADD
jgi:hypothetical protein